MFVTVDVCPPVHGEHTPVPLIPPVPSGHEHPAILVVPTVDVWFPGHEVHDAVTVLLYIPAGHCVTHEPPLKNVPCEHAHAETLVEPAEDVPYGHGIHEEPEAYLPAGQYTTHPDCVSVPCGLVWSVPHDVHTPEPFVPNVPAGHLHALMLIAPETESCPPGH